MSTIVKNLTVILGLITVAFAAYFIFTQQSSSTLNFATNDEVLGNMLASSQLFIERRQQLEAISLDVSFFSDPRFTSLQSFSGPITEQPIGRSDPFATVRPLATDQN